MQQKLTQACFRKGGFREFAGSVPGWGSKMLQAVQHGKKKRKRKQKRKGGFTLRI